MAITTAMWTVILAAALGSRPPFQSQNSLNVDGVAAEQTLSLLYSGDARQAAVTPTPDPSAMPSLVNKKYPVSSDDRPGDLVLLRNVLPSSLVYVKGSEIEATARR